MFTVVRPYHASPVGSFTAQGRLSLRQADASLPGGIGGCYRKATIAEIVALGLDPDCPLRSALRSQSWMIWGSETGEGDDFLYRWPCEKEIDLEWARMKEIAEEIAK